MSENNFIDDGTMNVEEAKKEIVRLFAYHGFHEYVKIDDEAVGMLLTALRQEDVRTVRSNGEGGIIIEFNEEGSIGNPNEY
jgi:hypothetical protein